MDGSDLSLICWLPMKVAEWFFFFKLIWNNYKAGSLYSCTLIEHCWLNHIFVAALRWKYLFSLLYFFVFFSCFFETNMIKMNFANWMGRAIFQLCLKVYCFVSHNVVIYEKNTQKNLVTASKRAKWLNCMSWNTIHLKPLRRNNWKKYPNLNELVLCFLHTFTTGQYR